MLKLIVVIALCAVFGFTKADLCQSNITVGELPGGTQQELISIVYTGVVDSSLGCSGYAPVVDEDVKFFLYSRSNPAILLDPQNPIQVNTSKPTILLTHGWTCSINGSEMPEMKKAYLQRYDCNVIGIDWSARSIATFASAYCSVPGVATIVGEFLCTLKTLLNVDLSESIHFLGHSMGAQIAGLAGQYVQQNCNQIIGRITGLDPAGVIYQKLPPSARLDASDALFVDVIHTNQGVLGYYGPCGDVDFFPNCGFYQPGCRRVDSGTPLQELMNLPISVVVCSHFRSCDYMIESINPANKPFTATSCLACPGAPYSGPCLVDLFNQRQTVMGEDCPNNPPAPRFFLTTNSQSPFAKG